MLSTPAVVYQGTWYFWKAQVTEGLVNKINVAPSFWEKAAHERSSSSSHSVSPKRVLNLSTPYASSMYTTLIQNIARASKISLFSLVGLMSFFLVRGRSSKGKKHLSGKKIISARTLARKLKFKRKASKVKIGSLPYVKGTETQHTLITGGTGSGKTNCLFHILSSVEKQNQRKIIIDTNGSFVNRYYRKDRDVLLSLSHSDSVDWNPWSECQNRFDYEALSESLIPSSYSDHENYWRQAAQSLFSSLLQKTGDTQKTSEIVRWMLFEPLSDLCQFVQGTKAAAHMDLSAEKTAGSIRSVASSFVDCLDLLQDSNNPFSITNWVKEGKEDSNLFIHCDPSQRAAAIPLISTWTSLAIRGILNLTPDLDRRIWLILDELPSLNKIKDLETFLSEGRKYGGCGILSLQSPAQLEAIYGRESTRTIIGNCATKIVFSEQDPEVASRISRAFGEKEVQQTQEGISYGAHQVRDGVSLSKQTRMVPVVSSTDIQSLKKNRAFVKLPGNYPITIINTCFV